MIRTLKVFVAMLSLAAMLPSAASAFGGLRRSCGGCEVAPVRSGAGPGPRRGEVRGTHRDPLQAGHEGEGSHLLRQQAGAARSSAP